MIGRLATAGLILVTALLSRGAMSQESPTPSILSETAKRYFSKSYEPKELGLYAIPPNVMEDIYKLWQISRLGSSHEKISFISPFWKNKVEFAPFFLANAIQAKPRVSVQNYFGRVVPFPELEDYVKPKDREAVLNPRKISKAWAMGALNVLEIQRRRDQMPLSHALLTTSHAVELLSVVHSVAQTETYKKSRSWEREGLLGSLLVREKFDQFKEESVERQITFEHSIQSIPANLRAREMKEAQQFISEDAPYRIELVGDRMVGVIENSLERRPDEKQLKRPESYESLEPFWSDEYVRGLLVLAGIGYQNGSRELKARMEVARALKRALRNPETAEQVRRMMPVPEQVQKWVAFLRTAGEKIAWIGRLPWISSMAWIGIGAALTMDALDTREAFKNGATADEVIQRVSKTISRTGASAALLILGTNPIGLATIGIALALEGGRHFIDPNVPTADDLFEVVGAISSDAMVFGMNAWSGVQGKNRLIGEWERIRNQWRAAQESEELPSDAEGRLKRKAMAHLRELYLLLEYLRFVHSSWRGLTDEVLAREIESEIHPFFRKID